jgi:hypothetical protein
MQTKTRIALAAAALALSGGIISAPSAVAGTAASQAPSVQVQGYGFHMYKDDNYKGGVAWVTHTDTDLRNNYWVSGPDKGKKVDNGTSSAFNNTRSRVLLWQNVGCTGAVSSFGPGGYDPDLSDNPIKDNRLSCVQFR